jgi:hypothetical protein
VSRVVVVVTSLLVACVRALVWGGRIGRGCSSRSLRRAHSAADAQRFGCWSGLIGRFGGSGGCDLLVEGVGVGLLVLDAVEVLAVDVGERRAVAGVAEEQVEHRPDE